ncbi:MAG: TIGR03915 family putative DNA repair protein [Oscillospiraceae bacterium]
MAKPVIYAYDGSYNGLMCCVFESFRRRETPVAVEILGREQPSLFPVREIPTEEEKAERVKKSIPLKISLEAKELVEQVYLSCLGEKEVQILRFLRLGYAVGGKVCEMLAQEEVAVLKKAALSLAREAHSLLGFIRFSQYDGVLMAAISPRNNVLPLIADHFCNRLSGETFMIFDKVHKVALVYRDGRREFLSVENVEEPKADPEEEAYRGLWRAFFQTIGIEGRRNPRCQQNHLPLRYRENMTEFR